MVISLAEDHHSEANKHGAHQARNDEPVKSSGSDSPGDSCSALMSTCMLASAIMDPRCKPHDESHTTGIARDNQSHLCAER